jgi:hypothetical protein
MSCFAKKLTELVFPANNTFTQYYHQRKRLFDDIYGYDNIKRLFRMALDTTNHPTFILLPPKIMHEEFESIFVILSSSLELYDSDSIIITIEESS